MRPADVFEPGFDTVYFKCEQERTLMEKTAAMKEPGCAITMSYAEAAKKAHGE